MIALIFFVLAALASPFKSKRRLEAENAALQHQLIMRRKVRGRVQLTNGDRWFFVQLYRFATSRARTPIIDLRPERDLAGRYHRIPTNQSADFSDGHLRLAQFDL